MDERISTGSTDLVELRLAVGAAREVLAAVGITHLGTALVGVRLRLRMVCRICLPERWRGSESVAAIGRRASAVLLISRRTNLYRALLSRFAEANTACMSICDGGWFHLE
jgi:hypothetical protein